MMYFDGLPLNTEPSRGVQKSRGLGQIGRCCKDGQKGPRHDNGAGLELVLKEIKI